MPNEKQKDPDITLKLSDFIKVFLGDNHYLTFPKGTEHLADLVEIKSHGTFLCHVQFPDKYNPDLTSPVLWLYGKWIESTERWERCRIASEERVLNYNLFEANVKLIARHLVTACLMSDERALPVAYSLLKNDKMQQIRALGIGKLLTKKEEL